MSAAVRLTILVCILCRRPKKLLQVSSSMVSDRRRIAKEYEIRWLGYLHPNINKGPWSNDELDRLRQTVASLKDDKVDWCEVSEKLGVCACQYILCYLS